MKSIRVPNPMLLLPANTLATAGVLSAVLWLAACAKRETPVQAGIRTQTLHIGNHDEPADLDPHVAAAVGEGNILLALFEGLTAEGESGEAVPAAAERWDISPDGLTYTFHLRPWRRELGIEVAVQSFELKTLLQNLQAKRYEIGLIGWFADFPDPSSFLELFVTDGGNNWTSWSNATYDALIARAKHTADPAARFEIFQEAEALLLEEAPIVLDVPANASALAYGFFVSGGGKMWVNGQRIEVVGPDVPTTNMVTRRALPRTPTNLGFDPNRPK